MTPADQPDSDSLLFHLIELRRRLLWCVAIVSIVFLGCFYFSSDLYDLFTIPLIHQLPKTSHLIATGIAATLIAPLKLSLIISFFICMPVLLYHLWAFVGPALYLHERNLVFPLLFFSALLFYLGVGFAYFVILPLMFQFFMQIAPSSVTVMPDMTEYLDFTIKLFFAFGVSFEVPVLVYVLIRTGIVDLQTLTEKRPYVIVLAFIIGMLLTPPDVLSQTMLAIPLWFLYEAGLLAARWMQRGARQ